MKYAILAGISLLLNGCVCVIREDAPYVKYYRSLNPEIRDDVIRPIRTDTHIGYQDRNGNIHLWPAN